MSNTPFTFGAKGDGLTDDTAALQRWVDHGGGEIPTGNFVFNGPLKFSPGFTISKWQGNLMYRRGWPSGYAICSRDWTRLSGGVRIDASAGGEIIYVGDSDLPRKGLGLTYLEKFQIINPTVVGGAAPKGINLFSAEVRGCKGGTINGGRFSIRSGQEGADGIHFTDSNSDISVIGAKIASGDDSIGLTVELSKFANCTMERISFVNCLLGNEGHSSLKVLLATVSGHATIKDILLKNCTLSTQIAQQGTGVAVIANNRARSSGGKIVGLTIDGGTTTVVPNAGRYLGAQAMQFRSIDGLKLLNHTVNYWSPVALSMFDCPGFAVEGCEIKPVGPVPPSWRQPALIQIEMCAGSHVDLSRVRPGWSGQKLVDTK